MDNKKKCHTLYQERGQLQAKMTKVTIITNMTNIKLHSRVYMY